MNKLVLRKLSEEDKDIIREHNLCCEDGDFECKVCGWCGNIVGLDNEEEFKMFINLNEKSNDFIRSKLEKTSCCR
mgnify:CR=1 FL=1